MVLNAEKTKILVVDDDDEIRDIVRVLLTSEGYEVVEAFCGEKAISYFEPSIDLVILDIMMPQLSGYEVCRKIREEYNVPIGNPENFV